MINLTGLFETQRLLDAEIERKHPIDFNERIYKINLALLVELGELANEQRSWKFWSTDQNPRYEKHHTNGVNGEWWVTYPLLEEYVDCLHFILSIGNFIEHVDKEFPVGRFYREETIEKQFLLVFEHAVNMQHDDYYYDLVQSFLRLGEMLGFSWEQIETAYMNKNEINHQRQADGY